MRFLEKQQLIIIFLAAVIFVGFGLLRYYPLAKQKKNIEKTNNEQLFAASEAKAYSMKLPFLRRHIAAVREKTKDYDIKIPQTRQFAELWKQIASVMNRHNLKDQLVQPGTEIQGSRVNRIPLTIECSGSLNEIFDLFESLRDFDRLIRIEDIKLINDKDFAGPIKMTVEANVYYCPGETRII